MATQNRNARVLEELLKLPGNTICADCRNPAPRWCSINLGIFLCINCASVHRKLGTHISKVKSVTLDTLTREQIDVLKSIGNTKSNEKYATDNVRNPPPTNLEDSARDNELEKYIRKKYTGGTRLQNHPHLGRERSITPPSSYSPHVPSFSFDKHRPDDSPPHNSNLRAATAAAPARAHSTPLPSPVKTDPPKSPVFGKMNTQPPSTNGVALGANGFLGGVEPKRRGRASSNLSATGATILAYPDQQQQQYQNLQPRQQQPPLQYLSTSPSHGAFLSSSPNHSLPQSAAFQDMLSIQNPPPPQPFFQQQAAAGTFNPISHSPSYQPAVSDLNRNVSLPATSNVFSQQSQQHVPTGMTLNGAAAANNGGYTSQQMGASAFSSFFQQQPQRQPGFQHLYQQTPQASYPPMSSTPIFSPPIQTQQQQSPSYFPQQQQQQQHQQLTAPSYSQPLLQGSTSFFAQPPTLVGGGGGYGQPQQPQQQQQNAQQNFFSNMMPPGAQQQQTTQMGWGR